MKKKYYSASISEKTPEILLNAFKIIAFNLAKKGYILRTNGEKIMDRSFVAGALDAGGKIETYIPWAGYNDYYYSIDEGYFITSSNDLFNYANKIASDSFFNWNLLTVGTQKLYVRDIFQLFGNDINKPSDFLISWVGFDTLNRPSGSSSHIFRVARDKEIKTFNFNKKGDQTVFTGFYKELC